MSGEYAGFTERAWRAYAEGKYRCSVPPVPCSGWDHEAWLAHIFGPPSVSDCCGARLQRGPDDGGAREGWCRDCHEELCSRCASVFEEEDGYGDDGRGVRTHALCEACHGEREDRRQRREARNDSGV